MCAKETEPDRGGALRVPMLGRFTDSHNNNLDAIRLIAALFVLISHSFPLSGYHEPVTPFYNGSYGTLGVNMFFIISGFLITRSYLMSHSPARFLKGRFLRIFPALMCVVLFTTFILGPLVTTLPLGAYFSSGTTYSYLRTISLYDVRYYLPGVFGSNPYQSAVNGSLWTLRYEFSLYLLVLALGMLMLLRRRGVALAFLAIALVLEYFQIGKSMSILRLNVFDAVRFSTYFAVGMTAYLYRDSIPLKAEAFLLAAIMVVIASLRGGFSDTLFVFILGYIVLFVGYSPYIHLSWLAKFGDFSYGVYIWAFPVQQTVMYLYGRQMNPWLLAAASGAISLTLGAGSWHLLEKRMLRLKNARLLSMLERKPSATTSGLS